MRVRCDAVRWVDDEPQPGVIEVVLTDAHGTAWTFIDKVPIFDAAGVVQPDSDFPIALFVACNVIERRADDVGRELSVIDLLPWDITDRHFIVANDQLVSD